MMKAFIGQPLPDAPIVELLRPNLGQSGLDRWTERYARLEEPVVELTASPEEADIFVVPHNYNLLVSKADFLRSFEALSEEHGKSVIIFFPGDSAAEVPVKNAIVFRNSQYRSRLRSNEIMMPGYVEDLGKGLPLKPREKRPSSSKPVIGFCGWAYPGTSAARARFNVKAAILDVRYVFGDRLAKLKQKGLWWRKKTIKALSRSKLVDTDFIIRKSYSGNEKTISLDPAEARREYIGNILSSDFTLCVKGDGNFSTRFYEVLSLGRIPLFLDTECVLPLESAVDYSKCVLKVDSEESPRIDKIAADFYAKLSNERFIEMQREARSVFENCLRLDSFFKRVFLSGFLAGHLRKNGAGV